MEAEAILQRRLRRLEVVDGDHDVVDARGHGVEAGARLTGVGRLLGRGIGSVPGDLDAMCLGEQHAEQLLGEVGIDARLDRLLPASDHHDVANTRRLDDRRVGALLDRGDLAAHRQPFGDDRDQRAVELIDSGAQVVEFGHHLHRTWSAELRSL